jgi:hypothetical protein
MAVKHGKQCSKNLSEKTGYALNDAAISHGAVEMSEETAAFAENAGRGASEIYLGAWLA